MTGVQLKEARETRLSLGDIAAAVRKHWILASACFVVALALAAVITASMTRIYEAEATIYFDARPPQPLGAKVEPVVDTSADYWNRKEYYNTQQWILTSRATLEPAVTRLRLHFDRNFVKNKPGVDRANEPVVTPTEAAAILAKRMKVAAIPDSRLAKVTYRDADPARSAEVLRAVTKIYVGQNEEELMAATSEASTWLHGQMAVLRDDLEKSEVELNDYKENKNLLSVSLDDQSNMLREEIQQLNGALTAARAKRQQVAARNVALNSVAEDNPSELPARELLESNVLQTLRSEYVSARRELDSLKGTGKGDNHPEVVAARARLETTRLALLAEVKNIKRSVGHDLQATDAEIGGLQRLFDQARDKALDVNRLEIEYKRMRRTRDTNERLFSLVTERSKESDLARLLRANNVRVVDAPIVPQAPVSPNLPLNLLGGSLAGLLLGLAGAIARESLDRSLRGPEDAENILGLPLLGMLPANGRIRGGYSASKQQTASTLASLDRATHEHPMSAFAEAARSIRTSIAFSSPDQPLRTLLVTSAEASDGKTTVASNLAIAMAQTGQKVILVDCDLRRSRIHDIYHVDNQHGLTSAVIGPRPVEAALIESEVPGLRLLPSGPLPPNPSELLHSKAFREMLEQLRRLADVVIIDSPPLVPVTDAAVISTNVDAVVLVARSFKTSRVAAERAVRILRDVGGKGIGFVLNALEGSGVGSGYYAAYARRSNSDRPPAA